MCHTEQHSMVGLWVHEEADVLKLIYQTCFRLKPKSRIMYLVYIQITASEQTQNLEHSHCTHNATIYHQNIRGLINKTEELLIVISMKQSISWEANWPPDRQEIPTFYGTQRLTTAFTTAYHLSLFWATLIQSMPPHPISWRSILKISSNAWLIKVVSFPQVSPPKPHMHPPLPIHATFPAHPISITDQNSLHIACLTDHHTKSPEILKVNLSNYSSEATGCRQL